MGVMFLLFIIFVEMKHLKLTIGPQILHPETIMERLGINWEVSMPKYIWDEWWFWNCTNIPDDLPDYITKLNLDPKDWSDFVDCGFSFEEATKIISKKCPEN